MAAISVVSQSADRPQPSGPDGPGAGPFSPAPVHVLFQRQAATAPTATALRFDGGEWSYQQLDQLATRLARVLALEGVTRGTPVAICLDRAPETIGLMLAILKAGGMYMPLERDYPRARIRAMLAVSGAPIVITSPSLMALLPDDGGRVILLDQLLERCGATDLPPSDSDVSPTDPAYIMFTSGSTGEPKGVEVVHRAIDRLVRGVDYVELGPAHAVLQAAPLAFDASTFEIWGPLLTGGQCVLYPDRIPTADGLGRVLTAHGVTTVWLTAGLFNAIIDEAPEQLRGLQQLLIGGEALSVPHVRRAQSLLPGTRIVNGYGPTETTTFAACYVIPTPLPSDLHSIPIGRPLRDTCCYILDEAREPVPLGATGELYIGGSAVARGYVGRPELTAERFLADPYRGEPDARMYRTGDLVRSGGDGNLEYVGRVDDQVKISGYRIEPREIATRLESHPEVRQCVVVARPRRRALGLELVAYVVPQRAAHAVSPTTLREHVRSALPAYMVPAAFEIVGALPLTVNGKVDLRSLPVPHTGDEHGDEATDLPRTDLERLLADVWGELLGERIGVLENVFDRGVTSLLVVRALAQLRGRHHLDIPVTHFFRYPTIAGLAAAVSASGPAQNEADPDEASHGNGATDRSEPVAIVGMAVRFPGAPDLQTFWQNLRTGVDSITHFTETDLDPDVDRQLREDPAYVRARGILPDVDRFDEAFFGMTRREAELMDPQQRLFLELAWTALEHAGCDPARSNGRVGVFGGVYNNSYATSVLARRPDVIERFGAFNAMLLNEKDYVAPRIAHALGLTGPAVSIHTACSTSLVAVCQAVRSLRSRECEVALAGGVALTIPTASGYRYQEGGMLSADGHTRPFDARASGTVFSDGAGMVVLKRLSDASRDGDTIYGIIRGVAVNNDGAEKASFTAPSVDGQAAVIRAAQQDAGVSPRSISYVEAHGTATPLGDPIEFEGLKQVFARATSDIGFCRLGSVKSNIGHTVIAAGVAGLIKTVLALWHEELPPTAHFTAANPAIDLVTSPFTVPATVSPWPRAGEPRRAGVSSFGVGGTNAHVVLEEAPLGAAGSRAAPVQLLLVSARTPGTLTAAVSRLAAHLEASPELQLSDVAYTQQVGRSHFAHRRAIVARDRAEALAALHSESRLGDVSGVAPRRPTDVVFTFPGQGSQYPSMGAALYAEERVYRDAFDRCAEAAAAVTGRDLREALFTSGPQAAERLQQTVVTQPAIFATEFALAALWESWGVRPRAMIGHSVGEFVCAAIAGVFSPEQAARVVAARGRAMQALPRGSMLSVRLSAEAISPRLSSELAIASENGPSLSVVSGPEPHIEQLRRDLEAERIACRLLDTSHAFHSAMMDPVVEPIEQLLNTMPLAAPRIPFVSTVTGTWITADEARDPGYWARHLRKTVRFAAGVRTLLDGSPAVFLELGPRSTLTTLVKQQLPKEGRSCAVAALGDAGTPERDGTATLAAMARLWTAGVQLDWQAVHAGTRRRRVALPTYPFERTRHWVEGGSVPQTAVPSQATPVRAAACDVPVPVQADTAADTIDHLHTMAIQNGSSSTRRSRFVGEIREQLEQVSGLDLGPGDSATSLVELGFDSLALTQVALALSKTYRVKLTFRQLLEEYSTVDHIAQHLDGVLPADPEKTSAFDNPPAATASEPGIAPSAATTVVGLPVGPASDALRAAAASVDGAGSSAARLIAMQLRVMEQQLAVLGASNGLSAKAEPIAALSSPPTAALRPSGAVVSTPPLSSPLALPPDAEPMPSTGPQRAIYDAKKAFGAAPRITVGKADHLTPKQRARLDAFVRRYTSRTKESKRFTQEHRLHMADPRVATGFRPTVKELVYPLVVKRSAGSRMWDLDGNEYIDVLSGFGSNLFGWSAPFVVEAVRAQLERGFELGPQQPLAGEVAELFCNLTGHDRVAFCNTGSEAVLGAIRVARTVTGRNTIAVFSGSYHGINDEVIVRAGKTGRAVSAAPGILPAAVQNVLVLDYGSDEALAAIRARGEDLAAVIVEPVQSRRPDLRPREFLHELRRITEQMGIVYVWDEIVTGFRVAQGGAQEYFGVRADLATYGKVVGGGLPIGILAGQREYMDALDGGFWRFGDDSVPEIGVTYFAGTFVRHPLALAAAKAVLQHLAQHGPGLQRSIADRTDRLADELNRALSAAGAPLEVRHFASIWKTFILGDHPNADLLFYLLRDGGVHLYEGFPCFMTAAHTDEDVAQIVRAFTTAVGEMQESEFLPGTTRRDAAGVLTIDAPPVPGARLGRDRDGTPAWFVASTSEPGRFIRVAPV